MTTTTEYKWKKVWRCGSFENHEFCGHTVFLDEISGRLAIADMSGDTPDQTDDGVLWLDDTPDRQFVIRKPNYQSSYDYIMIIPLVLPDGRKSNTVSGIKKAADLFKYITTHHPNYRLSVCVHKHAMSHLKRMARIIPYCGDGEGFYELQEILNTEGQS